MTLQEPKSRLRIPFIGSETATPAWHRRVGAARSLALALALGACGGGGGGGDDGTTTPQIVVAPLDRRVIVGQVASFYVETQGSGTSLGWQEQATAGSDWNASTWPSATEGLAHIITVGPVGIGMDKSRFRGQASNAAGSVTSAEAALEVAWGSVTTMDSTGLDFGANAAGGANGGSIGGADGGSPGGGDGEGAGVGGGLGKTPRAIISVTRIADGASLGSAPADAKSGLVRVKAGPGVAPVLITLTGAPDATYYDEGRGAMLPLPADRQLHALVLDFDRHLGVTTLTEAAYIYALNNFLQDPAAVRAGTLPVKRTATPAELARLTPAQVQLANEAVRNAVNKLLPPRYALDSISTLPVPVDDTSARNATTDDIYGRMQAAIGGLALAAARFDSSLGSPALSMNTQLVDDLSDGTVDGVALDQRSVVGPAGTNAYAPASLSQTLVAAADTQFGRFSDGTVRQGPAITGQPASATITNGGAATLSVTATGSLLAFQWFRSGTPIPDATRTELTTSQPGSYRVDVSNTLGSVTSATVTVTAVNAPVAPSITTQPALATITAGGLMTFAVQATGTDLRYQWQLVTGATAADIPGATSNTYGTGTAGTYRVRVTNASGTVTSDAAALNVTPSVVAPRIIRQPTASTIGPAQATVLRVLAAGSPLAFQWHDERGPIANATASAFTTSVAGTYRVVVSNSAASVESNRVTLAVTTQPADGLNKVGMNVTGAEYSWGSVPTAESLDYLRRHGMTTLRVSTTWELWQPDLNGPLKDAYVSSIKKLAVEAAARNMHLIIAIQNSGRYNSQWREYTALNGNFRPGTLASEGNETIGSPNVPYSAFADVWRRIATELRDLPTVAAYDLMSHVVDMGAPDVWPKAAQAATDAIRSIDSAKTIVVEGDGWSRAAIWRQNNELLNIVDPARRLVYSAHVYFDAAPGTGAYAGSYDALGTYPDLGVDRVAPFLDWLAERGFRGHIGQFGVPTSDDRWMVVMDRFLKRIRAAGVGASYWNFAHNNPGDAVWWPLADFGGLSVRRDGRANPQLDVLELY